MIQVYALRYICYILALAFKPNLLKALSQNVWTFIFEQKEYTVGKRLRVSVGLKLLWSLGAENNAGYHGLRRGCDARQAMR